MFCFGDVFYVLVYWSRFYEFYWHLHLVFQHKRQLTLHTSFSPSIIEVSSLCLHLSNFKTAESLYLCLQGNKIETQFSHIIKCHLLQKVFKLPVLWSHQLINQRWRRNLLVMKTFPIDNLVHATWIIYNCTNITSIMNPFTFTLEI